MATGGNSASLQRLLNAQPPTEGSSPPMEGSSFRWIMPNISARLALRPTMLYIRFSPHLRRSYAWNSSPVLSLLCLFLYLHLYPSLFALYLTFIIAFALARTPTTALAWSSSSWASSSSWPPHLHMHIHTCTCISDYIYIYIYIHTYIIHIYISIHVSLSLFLSISLSLYIYIYIYVYTYSFRPACLLEASGLTLESPVSIPTIVSSRLFNNAPGLSSPRLQESTRPSVQSSGNTSLGSGCSHVLAHRVTSRRTHISHYILVFTYIIS